MNSRYLSLTLAYSCLLPTTVYLYGCTSQSPIKQKYTSESQQIALTPIEENSSLDSEQTTSLSIEENLNLESQPVIPKPQLYGIAARINIIAEAITVRIDAPNENGSGVIIAQDGETYYVLTAQHVVAKERDYQIVTPDDKQYTLDYSEVKKIPGADLAVLQFTSQKNYQVATIANYKSKEQEAKDLLTEMLSKAGSSRKLGINDQIEFAQKFRQISANRQDSLWLFLFGWQRRQNRPQPRLTAGRDINQRDMFLPKEGEVTTSFKNINSFIQAKGYGLSYTNFSQGGMSGGAVLDTQGRVIGIHAATEGERVGLREIQLGNGLGIPIKTFLDSVKEVGISSELLTIETFSPSSITPEDEQAITESLFQVTQPIANARATDWINYGNEMWRLLRGKEAIAAFDKAIKLQPDLPQAHYGKGVSLLISEDPFKELQNSEQQEEKIDREIGEKVLAALAKSTELDPNFEAAWEKKALLLLGLERYPEALVALDNTLQINPNNDFLYFIRGLLLMNSRPSESVEALTRAISIKPKVTYYFIRESVYKMIGDSQNAKADMEKIRELDPEFLGKYGQSSF